MNYPVYSKLRANFGSSGSNFGQSSVDGLSDEDDQAQRPESQTPALELSTLPSHPLRADDVTCFLPKVIG